MQKYKTWYDSWVKSQKLLNLMTASDPKSDWHFSIMLELPSWENWYSALSESQLDA